MGIHHIKRYAGPSGKNWVSRRLLTNTAVCILATNAHCRAFLDRATKLCPDLAFIPDVNKAYAEMEGKIIKELDADGGSFNITMATLRNKEAKRPISEVLRRYAACCDRIVEIYRANGYTPEARQGPQPR